MTWVKGCNGQDVDFDGAAMLMDDDIREELHSSITPCSNQEFMDAYCKAHFAKFGEEFVVN